MMGSAAVFAVMMTVAGWVASSPAATSAANGSCYGFYRSMGGDGWGGRRAGAQHSGTRRVFGGAAAPLSVYPAVCALLDRYWSARCTAAVVAARWAVTAAHCISPEVTYVKYNTRRPSSPDGNVVPVHYLYRHPDFKVVQEDEGRGMDVTQLHHDLGLVRTRDVMTLASVPPVSPLLSMQLYNPIDLKDREVQVLGFGRTEKSMLGEELFSVDLQLVFCDRGTWFHCLCGVAAKGAAREQRGVCSGDSGGPVLFRGAQVGVTSMGPLECASASRSLPATGATSVFTALYNYANLVNRTIFETDASQRMRKLPIAHAHPSPNVGAARLWLLVPLAAAAALVIPVK